MIGLVVFFLLLHPAIEHGHSLRGRTGRQLFGTIPKLADQTGPFFRHGLLGKFGDRTIGHRLRRNGFAHSGSFCLAGKEHRIINIALILLSLSQIQVFHMSHLLEGIALFRIF